MSPTASGCPWGIRAEVGGEATNPQVTVQEPSDCKSVAKATQVRILHLPQIEQRASDVALRPSGPCNVTPGGTVRNGIQRLLGSRVNRPLTWETLQARLSRVSAC